MGKRYGEYIHLYWDTIVPEAFYIRGHVTDAEAFAVVLKEELDLHPVTQENMELARPEHKYARWAFDGSQDDGHCHVLQTYNESGRGRFPVTEIRIACAEPSKKQEAA